MTTRDQHTLDCLPTDKELIMKYLKKTNAWTYKLEDRDGWALIQTRRVDVNDRKHEPMYSVFNAAGKRVFASADYLAAYEVWERRDG